MSEDIISNLIQITLILPHHGIQSIKYHLNQIHSLMVYYFFYHLKILGYKIINADVLESVDKKWYRQGIVLAQKDGKSVGISTAMFTGTKSKRENANITYFTLPKESTCFSGQIIDSDFNVAIDCQTNDGNEDLVCYANVQKATITCTSVDSLNQVHTRKS
jgi:hypothetical protein